MLPKQTSLSVHLLGATHAILYAFLFLFPIFFLPFTLNLLEINKQTLLLLVSCASALLLAGSVLANGFVRVRLKWMYAFPFFLLVFYGVSSWFSLAPYTSWIGLNGSAY